jgi:hypothetical protein
MSFFFAKSEELIEPLEPWSDNVHNVAESIIYQREKPRLSKKQNSQTQWF